MAGALSLQGALTEYQPPYPYPAKGLGPPASSCLSVLGDDLGCPADGDQGQDQSDEGNPRGEHQEDHGHLVFYTGVIPGPSKAD